RFNRLPFYQSAYSAAMKLEGSLPIALREHLRAMSRVIHIRPSQVSRIDDKATVYEQLVEARSTRHVIRIEYESQTEWDKITTKLRPYHLLFCRHSWYVIGRSSLHGEVRTFNLSRIVNAELLSDKFAVPKGFSIERHFRNAWLLIPEPGADQH